MTQVRRPLPDSSRVYAVARSSPQNRTDSAQSRYAEPIKTFEMGWREKSVEYFRGLMVLSAIAALYLVGGYSAVWMFPDKEWSNKWRYSLESDLDDAVILIERLPHNCEFMSAPMGEKHCHYERIARTVRIHQNAGVRLLSLDEGKTWLAADPADRARVVVQWSKVED